LLLWVSLPRAVWVMPSKEKSHSLGPDGRRGAAGAGRPLCVARIRGCGGERERGSHTGKALAFKQPT
jgi:hypothetical protein